MNIAVVKERAPGEARVALVPGDISTLTSLGATVTVEHGAGFAAGFTDEQYQDKGAKLADRGSALSEADLLCAVRSAAAAPDSQEDLSQLKEGATVIAMMNPYGADQSFETMLQRRHQAFSLELIPRITRAQSMDVLSSQANLAGYRSVLLGALELPKMFPMMMTAAGTVVPARVFVVGDRKSVV